MQNKLSNTLPHENMEILSNTSQHPDTMLDRPKSLSYDNSTKLAYTFIRWVVEFLVTLANTSVEWIKDRVTYLQQRQMTHDKPKRYKFL